MRFFRPKTPDLDWTRIEVTRFHDIVTMDYEGGRRIRPDDRDEPGMYYQVIGFALQDFGHGQGLREYEHLLTPHKQRDRALKDGQDLAAKAGATFVDLTGGR